MNNAEELRRIDAGPSLDEAPGGIGLVEIKVRAEVAVADVMERSKVVLRAALTMPFEDLQSPTSWPSHLPEWFIGRCASEQSAEADEEWLTWWRGLDSEARAVAARERP